MNIEKIKKDIENKELKLKKMENEKAKNEGKLEQIKAKLKKEYDIETDAEIKEVLTNMGIEIKKLENSIEKKFQELNDLWED